MNKNKKLSHSFRVAFSGLSQIYATERNFRVHLMMAFLVIVAGIVLGLTRYDMISVLILIGLVLSLEMINASFELMFDVLHPHDSRSEKQDSTVGAIKDILAGAVLVTAIVSATAGVLIFYPYVISLYLK